MHLCGFFVAHGYPGLDTTEQMETESDIIKAYQQMRRGFTDCRPQHSQ